MRPSDHHPSEARIESLFSAQASVTPDAAAVLFRGDILSYGQLLATVEQFAADLIDLGVGPGVLVALCVARTPAMIAMLLAILKAGGAYLPLDQRYPAERLAFLLTDSAASVLITDRVSPAWEAFGGTVMQARGGRLTPRTRVRPAPVTAPAELAYVIYTSGSTGLPKGVMLGHGATALAAWARQAYSAHERSCVAATTSLCFDPSVLEIFMPLSTGGAVLLKDDALEPFRPDERPTMLDTVPSVLRELCRSDAIPHSVKVLNVGGEALPTALVRETYGRRPDLAIYNHYGPTEATTVATVGEAPPGLIGDPPLGRPVRGAEIVLLTSSGAVAAEGEVGEIHIGGAGLALGYLNRPELTAERFLLRPEGRVYRTGDLGFQRHGELYFAGRLDRQIKIRGFRIEPGEIEAALMGQPPVERALVVQREGPSGAQLIAYVESRDKPAPVEIRKRLMASLPSYMVPAHVIVLGAFPQLVSGKIDEAALPAPEQGFATNVMAATRAERPIMHVFEEVLGRIGVGPEDSFFDLGGDSLSSVRTALRLEEVFGHDLPAGLLHQAPTARMLAAALEQSSMHAGAHLSLLQPGGGAPPLFCLADLLGHPFNYLSLARALAADRTIYGLAPGPLEAAFAAGGDIDQLTAAFAAEVRRVYPAGPYLIAGYSSGGLLAAALAGALEREGNAVRLILLDAVLHSRPPRAGHIVRWIVGRTRGLRDGRKLGSQIGRLASSLRGASARSRSATPPQWVPRAKLAYAKQLIILGGTYRPATFRGPTLMVIAGERDPLDVLFDTDGFSGWAGVLMGEVTVANAPGGHHEFMREPNVAVTAAAVGRFLKSTQANDPASGN